MSPLALRIASRTAAPRNFSLLTSARSWARSIEAHPFERLPADHKVAAADWGMEFRRVGTQAALFFPGFALILGWPMLASKAFDGHV